MRTTATDNEGARRHHRSARGRAGTGGPAARAVRAAAAAMAAALMWMASPASSRGADDLFPFVMPWDDASAGPTSLSGWNRPIDGEADRLRVGADGHLYRGAERVRLWGFDVAAGAAFTDADTADRIASRLARLGVNYVRIAQNSNPVPSGWLNPVTGALDPRALARLDHFIAALRRRGIYVHLVLTHFRNVYPPGVLGVDPRHSPPDGWPPAGTGVTAFYTPVIAANDALARELLTHRNPYTGLTYAEDPAIAIVEVTNEDGLVPTWEEGDLDPLIAAADQIWRPVSDELRARWNRWLRARYPDDAALRASWAPGTAPAGRELLTNGGFERGAVGWRLELRGDAAARMRAAAGGPRGDTAELEVRVASADADAWHVTVSQNGLPVERGRAYRLTLWARAASKDARLTANLQQAHPPYEILSPGVDWTIGREWREYTAEFEATASDANAKLNLVAGQAPQQISLADLSLRRDAVAGLEDAESAAAGTVPPFPRATSAERTVPAQRDWVAFLFDTQRGFFQAEFRFLRDDLHVRSLLVGSQVDYSPADTQVGADVTSVHGYWAHPVFPGRPWDSVDWFVQNRSVTGARDRWYPLNRIAFYRRTGTPLVVDEYNHPQPNTFGAEGFPLAAAFGAFQDWDGVAGWAYREGWGSHWLTRKDWADPVIRDHFSLDTDPVRLLGDWLGAVVFRRGDVEPGKQLVTVGFPEEQEREIARTTDIGRAFAVVGRGAELLPLRHRVATASDAPPAPAEPAPPHDGPVVSDTGQLAWRTAQAGRGVVTVDTPRTAAVIGFGGGGVFPLGAVTLAPGRTSQNGFGVWAVTAMDGAAPLDCARRLIVVALGYSQNTGARWMIYPRQPVGNGPPPEGASITLGRQWGRPPVLVEGVGARILLPRGRRAHAWALDARGQRAEPVPVGFDQGRPVVRIGPQYRTLWYEIDTDAP